MSAYKMEYRRLSSNETCEYAGVYLHWAVDSSIDEDETRVRSIDPVRKEFYGRVCQTSKRLGISLEVCLRLAG